jgi:ketosteroid isomerase-like protein
MRKNKPMLNKVAPTSSLPDNAATSASRRIAALFRCIDGCDWQGLAGCLHDHIVYERPGYDALIGKDAVMEFYRCVRIVSSGRHMIEQVVSDGAHIACWGSFHGAAKDGRELCVGFADIYGIDGGLIRRRRTFFASPAI